jgi:hypothetical protein
MSMAEMNAKFDAKFDAMLSEIRVQSIDLGLDNRGSDTRLSAPPAPFIVPFPRDATFLVRRDMYFSMMESKFKDFARLASYGLGGTG